MNFLKALVLKLDSDTVNFFFNDRLKTFPVFQAAMSLYSFRDQLVKTSVRTITLQIFELKNDEMYKLFHVVPYCSFYSSLACHLRDLWIGIEKEIDQITPTDEHHVDVVIKQVEDANETLFYLQDLFTVL